MSRYGALTFGGLACKLDILRVSCAKCDRKGRYSVRWLIEDHGREGKVTDWLTTITADCPRMRSIDMSNQCGALCPELARAL